MSKRHDNTGRSIGQARHTRLEEWFMLTSAWRNTGVYERCLYIEIKRRYNGRNNGDIAMSHREAEHRLGCSNKPVRAAFKGLLEKGFIKVATKGSFDWKSRQDGLGNGRSTRWIITEHPVDVPGRGLTATKDFARWQPEGNSRCDDSPSLERPTPTTDGSKVCPEPTAKSLLYASGTR